MPTTHQMTRTRMLEHGVEEWSCTECSRRLEMRRPPAFEQTVLERGDEWVTHVGGTAGIRMAAIQARSGGPSDRERGWLAEHGMAWGP